ncbi:tRNA (adenosine(37)-N6)-threonylcarbamoyltransferase complex ATPase subunit type 1 TsaE [Thalassoroseus pseudoceratinae]|uniref:tRNA (adenosine(37)-N6)-threonylcarbamoyltransferase complex ATPase subunit type 1 TsaE n=1 Tax=Thalassoroseus pseudoceratinae TaxID=2713176 RepID=UPI00141EA0C2|nr:tRNA (adenosine(37)-N6)-threonylcarbamoyltransferase complex ATPase subunit type 1 TsaE [Thalassoroseus pseudoceratinae]
MATVEFIANDEPETARFGCVFGTVCVPNLVVGLVGDLGAGKTRFVRAVAGELGVPTEMVNSPTYILIHEYAGRLPVFHFDTYRLRDEDEFLELGVDELFSAGGVCLIEWANRVEEILPVDRLWIDITVTGPESRKFKITSNGELTDRVLAELRKRIDSAGL